MKELTRLYKRIIQRVNINLREFNFDVEPFICDLVPFGQLEKVHGFYAVTSQHPLDFQFRHSNLAGSYLLGKCRVTNSILYKSDIRGDELKKKGTVFHVDNFQIPLIKDEGIRIEDSFFIKTLVHNYSHDPETPERFTISNTVSTHYANIHGSPTDGTFLGPFATVDLSTVNDCIIGAFSYVQAGEINHFHIEPGTVWVRSPGNFNFLYRYPADTLHRYIRFYPGSQPRGIFIDFVDEHKKAFERIFATVNIKPSVPVPPNASLDRFAVVNSRTSIEDNVLVAQRSFLQNSRLGRGANAQENCFIINSKLAGYNVTAHGAKLINVDLEELVFVGFNSFLRGQGCRLAIGRDSIIMPHTIIDSNKPLHIPAGSLVWGLVTNEDELATNSISLQVLRKLEDGFSRGNLVFEGSGNKFVSAFQNRIHHILDANGAFYDGTDNKGHAQKNQNISFNIIQPYSEGNKKGVYPTIVIGP
jgi:carbonic anhydrase/acetyltransferase-like protein (isoleucine patch superfamily)